MDAEAGVVGYDEDGGKIFDVDLMEGKIIESMEERQQREVTMLIQQIQINLPQ